MRRSIERQPVPPASLCRLAGAAGARTSAILACLLTGPWGAVAGGAQEPAATPSRTIAYRRVGDRPLSAHVFLPHGAIGETPPSTILLFHGGGWTAGEPSWTFPAARRFAEWGLVAVAIEYRLSNDSVTPIDALADVCAALGWARTTRDFPHGARLAAYGVSAGGHLVAAAATVGCPDSTPPPDALLLWSPALDLERDGWFRRLLRQRAHPAVYSPAGHVRRTTPPTSIVHGEEDTLTPLAGARRYCEALRGFGRRCDLNTYPRVGHLLTRNLAEQEQSFDPDPEARADGIERQRHFLASLGFLAR